MLTSLWAAVSRCSLTPFITPLPLILSVDWSRACHVVLCIFTIVNVHRPNDYSTILFNDSLATDALVTGYSGTLTALTSSIDLNELFDNLEPGVMNQMCAFEIRLENERNSSRLVPLLFCQNSVFQRQILQFLFLC